MTTPCTFCGSAVDAQDPVSVAEVENGETVEAGRFCNYACLAQHIEAEGLEAGTTCRLDAA